MLWSFLIFYGLFSRHKDVRINLVLNLLIGWCMCSATRLSSLVAFSPLSIKTSVCLKRMNQIIKVIHQNKPNSG